MLSVTVAIAGTSACGSFAGVWTAFSIAVSLSPPYTS
jgi:hypothetical protein